MERPDRSEIGKTLKFTLGEWQSDYANMDPLLKLGGVIKDAGENGIDLVLKMPKNITQRGQFQRPMDMADALEFSSGTDGENIFITVPAEANRANYPKYKQFWLTVEDYDNVPSVFLRIGRHAILGVFHASEVASIEVK